MKKILIIGAGFLQDFVIMKARKMGYYTLAVDADSTAIGFTHADKYEIINIVDEKACLEFAQKEQIDGVLTAATDYGVLTAAYIAEHMGLPGLNYNSAKVIKNKYLVRKKLFENHVDDTEQSYEVQNNTNIESLAQKLIYPVMVKPCDGSGSRGTSRVDKPEMLKNACEYAMEGSITRRAEIETFITGEEYGVESLVVDGTVHILSIMKKYMTMPPYYAELGHAIPSGLPSVIEKKIKQCVKKALKVLEINHGSVNMDMIVTKEGGVHIIDIGARMGGNMIGPCIIPYGTGIDYVGNILRASVGEPTDWSVREHKAVVTKLLAFKGGVVKTMPDFEKIQQEYGVEIFHHLKEGDIINEYRTNLDGCGYIIAREKTGEIAKEKVDNVLKVIESEIF